MLGKYKGFTLLEIMIALFIFSIVSVMLTGALHHIIQTHGRVTARAETLEELQHALLLFSRDIEQTTHRPIVTANNSIEGFVGNDKQVRFVHANYNNPTGEFKKANLQRSQYTFNKDKFMRTVWSMLDQTPLSKSEDQVLLENVTQIKLAYLDNQNHWQNRWPLSSNAKQTLPKAVRIILKLKDWGTLSQIYQIEGQPFDKP